MEYIGENELNEKLDDFKNHLEHADRMILSAKFGDGKSFFLQKIRENREKFGDYEFITIYPVNYVVAANEDIFEYIKRDILIQLTKLGLLNKIDLTKLITSIFSFECFKEVLAFLVSCVPGGAFYNKLLEKAFDISRKYSDEKNTYEKYFGVFKTQKGGLYEDDAYTQMIKEALDLLKNGYINEKGKMIHKKPILIIEDLDRLDPAHLFRILNVISAHIDDGSRPDVIGNKFGFNNIVVVMDYDTTKYIFEHFYGKSASYVGYMSKFLTEEPFRYSLTEMALLRLKEKIIREVGVGEKLFNAFRVMNLKLSDLSMRDIKRLYDLDISKRIKRPVLKCVQDRELSLYLPIFKLLIYMTELGMSYADIDDELSLKKNYDQIEYLRLVYPLYLINTDYPESKFDYMYNNIIKIVLIREENVINDILVANDYKVADGKIPSPNELDKQYACFCLILKDYIDISGFNSSKSFSIPGYLPQS